MTVPSTDDRPDVVALVPGYQEGPRIARVVEGRGKGLGESEVLIELAKRKQARVAGKLSGGRLDNQGCAEEIEGLLPSALYTHSRSPWVVQRLS